MTQMDLTSVIRVICWVMKKVNIRQMQAAKMRMITMMCGKMLLDGNSECLAIRMNE